jgi:hypothetical protein
MLTKIKKGFTLMFSSVVILGTGGVIYCKYLRSTYKILGKVPNTSGEKKNLGARTSDFLTKIID